MEHAPIDDPPYATVDAIQASLDRRTVLINFFLGATLEGKVAISVIAITRERIRAAPISWNLPDSSDPQAFGGKTVQTTPVARGVALVRQQIQEFPGPDEPLSEDAAKILDLLPGALFGNLQEFLPELRVAGKDHLCIVPNGPLHFLPFHCIRQNGKPLAEEWIVTYLPNAGLLFDNRGRPTITPARDREIAAVGMSFKKANPYGLPPLPQSATEVEAIAAIFGVPALLEEQVTRSALAKALEHSRYVHLSTHGRHNVTAPAFQSLFIAPDIGDEGVLHSHEIFSFDLRGIEVLTLSACETALGRFDSGDNLRGIPASFLLAGVSTLIGTLWKVDADASRTFFCSFYQELKLGRDRRDAFAFAQRQTRSEFPRCCDWAPFYYMGSWK
jgi:CHAT domain-containing protein